MNTNKITASLTGVLLAVYILVVMLPMIQAEVDTATGVGGALETTNGVAILIALPGIILIVFVVALIKSFSGKSGK